MISKYDDVIANIPQEVLRIAKHLEIKISPEQAEQIAIDYTPEQQKQRIEKFRTQLLQQVSVQQNSDREIVDYHDEESLLHTNHISSGKIGQWRRELSLEQADLIEQSVYQWCQQNGTDPSIFLSSIAALA